MGFRSSIEPNESRPLNSTIVWNPSTFFKSKNRKNRQFQDNWSSPPVLTLRVALHFGTINLLAAWGEEFSPYVLYNENTVSLLIKPNQNLTDSLMGAAGFCPSSTVYALFDLKLDFHQRQNLFS